MSLFAELKRRNVFRVALFYVVTAWLIIEMAERSLFDVPDGVLRGPQLQFWLGQNILATVAYSAVQAYGEAAMAAVSGELGVNALIPLRRARRDDIFAST